MPSGLQDSRLQGGLNNNKYCTICNLYPLPQRISRKRAAKGIIKSIPKKRAKRQSEAIRVDTVAAIPSVQEDILLQSLAQGSQPIAEKPLHHTRFTRGFLAAPEEYRAHIQRMAAHGDPLHETISERTWDSDACCKMGMDDDQPQAPSFFLSRCRCSDKTLTFES